MKKIKKIKIHYTVFLAGIIFSFNGLFLEFILTIMFVAVHELSHIAAGVILGAKFQEVLVTPIGQNAVIKNIEKIHLHKRLLIYFAGPLISITIGLSLKILFKDIEVLKLISDINLCIGLFNLLPFLPFDGGCIVRNILSARFGFLNVSELIINLSKVFSVALIFFGVIQLILFPYNASLLVVGAYVYDFNKKEYLKSTYKFYRNIINMKDEIPKDRILNVRYIVVNKNEYAGKIAKSFDIDNYYIVYYFDDGKLIEKTQSQIMNFILTNGINEPIYNCA